jgi:P4 family phage/plasmid primase-like protien
MLTDNEKSSSIDRTASDFGNRFVARTDYNLEPPESLETSYLDSSIGTREKQAETDKSSPIKTKHREHLLSEGFTDEMINLHLIPLGIRSVSASESKHLGFFVKGDDGVIKNPEGLFFPFADRFGQIRDDEPALKDGKPAKYVSSPGKGVSKAYIPSGCKIVTEGLKDALACTFHGGIPTGAIAGVSGFNGNLKEGSGYVLLFDSDGWVNHQVFHHLIKGGKHVKGKIQLIPQIKGEPKAGACEYFKAGHTAQDFARLIDGAFKVEEFLFELPRHWSGLEARKLHRLAHALVRIGYGILKGNQLDALIVAIKDATGVTLGAMRDTIKALERKKALKAEKERRRRVKARGGVVLEIGVNDKGSIQMPGQGAVATAIANSMRGCLAYDPTLMKFCEYESKIPGVWSPELTEVSCDRVSQILDENEANGEYTQNYVSGAVTLMRGKLIVHNEQWNASTNLIPFRNGVLNVDRNELLSHNPAFRFRWGLPFDYEPQATCDPIKEWLLEVNGGHEDRVQLCRAWLRAVLTGQSGLQKFLYLVGAGGTGKTTFINLVEACVGQSNVVVSDLFNLEGNRFETANLKDKRLLSIHEVHKFAGDITVLKNVTGEAPIRYEMKGIQQGESFIFQGLVMMSGNEELRSNESTSALFRRKISLPFSVVVKPDQKRDLIGKDGQGKPTGEFAPYLSGFINWALSMPYEDMKAYIAQTSKTVPSLAIHAAEALTETNPMAAWLDERIVSMEIAKTYVGTLESEKSEYLYPNYSDFCLQHGIKPISVQRFSPLLIDLLRNQLKVPASKEKDSRGAFIRGVDIRSGASDQPRMITGDGSVTVSDGSVTVSMTVQTFTGDDIDGYDGSFQNQRTREKNRTIGTGEEDSSYVFSAHIQGSEDNRHNRQYRHTQGFEPSYLPSPTVTEPSFFDIEFDPSQFADLSEDDANFDWDEPWDEMEYQPARSGADYGELMANGYRNPVNPDLPGWLKREAMVRHKPSGKVFRVAKVTGGKSKKYKLHDSQGSKFLLTECEASLEATAF